MSQLLTTPFSVSANLALQQFLDEFDLCQRGSVNCRAKIEAEYTQLWEKKEYQALIEDYSARMIYLREHVLNVFGYVIQ